MADYKVTDTELIAVANAIRTKGGTQAQLEWPTGYIGAINAIPTGSGSGVTIVPFSSGTDEEIAAMIDAAHSGEIDLQQDGGWSLGDVRTINIAQFTDFNGVTVPQQDIDIVITNFGDYMNAGSIMQFDFKDGLSAKLSLTNASYDANVGGYGSMPFKTNTIPSLVNALPNWLKNRLIEFEVLATTGGYNAELSTVSGNLLALRSSVEIFGSSASTVNGQGTQLSYYTSTSNRKKKQGHSGQTDSWWTRSTVTDNWNNFIIYWDGGDAIGSGTNANSYAIIAPFGCL